MLPQDLVLSDPGADRMFDDRVYKRGALVLEALRRTVGDAAFAALLREWAATHRHGLVTTADFRSCVAVVTGSSHERAAHASGSTGRSCRTCRRADAARRRRSR